MADPTNTTYQQRLALSRLAALKEEGHLTPEESLLWMRRILTEPDVWEHWQRTFPLSLRLSSVEGEPEKLENTTTSLYQWALSVVASPQTGWWNELFRRWQRRWKEESDAFRTSLSMVSQIPAGVRARGGRELPPVAVFSEVPLALEEDHCSFTLRSNKIYAFTAYLPYLGYVAVLQLAENEGQVEHQLIYPQHGSHLQPMGPGGVHLFSTEFEVAGETQFLLLFSEVPFSSLAPEKWTEEMASWSWDQEQRDNLAGYLLAHTEALDPFLLQVDVQDDES